jgi:hypothetical protein
MNPVSQSDLQRNIQLAQEARMDIDWTDNLAASFDEGLRSSVTGSISRFVQNVFDTSEKLDPNAANERYGLAGTEYAFKPDQEVTREQAEAVADDYARVKYNDFINAVASEDAPVTTAVTGFFAGMAGSMLDPVSIVTGMGVSAGLGKLGAAAVNSARLMAIGNKLSPAAANAFTAAYSSTVTRNVGAVMLREGAENFVAAIADETVNFMDLGSERLSRKVTMEESVLNIIAGTVLGTGISTAASKEGRQAVGRFFTRKYGDAASNIVKVDAATSKAMADAGLAPTDAPVKIMEQETFGPKPWHEEVYTPSDDPKVAYIPVKEDGSPVATGGGRGTTLTDNINHAQNLGSSVIEADLSGTKIIRDQDFAVDGVPTKLGQEIVEAAKMDLNTRFSPEKMRDLLGEDGNPLTSAELRALFDVSFKGSTIADVADGYSSIARKLGIEDRFEELMDGIAKKNGMDGHIYTQRGADGKKLAQSINLTEEGAKKITKKGQRPVKKPDQSAASKHTEDLKARMAAGAEDIKKQLGEKPNNAPKPAKRRSKNNAMKDAVEANPERAERIRNTLAEVERRSVEDPTSVTETELKQAMLAKKLLESDDVDAVLAPEIEKYSAFLNCTLGDV